MVSVPLCVLIVTSPVQLPVYPSVNERSLHQAPESKKRVIPGFSGDDGENVSVCLMRTEIVASTNGLLMCLSECFGFFRPTSEFKSGNFHKNVASHIEGKESGDLHFKWPPCDSGKCIG